MNFHGADRPKTSAKAHLEAPSNVHQAKVVTPSFIINTRIIPSSPSNAKLSLAGPNLQRGNPIDNVSKAFLKVMSYLHVFFLELCFSLRFKISDREMNEYNIFNLLMLPSSLITCSGEAKCIAAFSVADRKGVGISPQAAGTELVSVLCMEVVSLDMELEPPPLGVPCMETSPEDMVLALDRGMGSGQPLVVALCMVASAEGKELDPEVGTESEPPLVVALCMGTSPEGMAWVVGMDMVLEQSLQVVPCMETSPEDMVWVVGMDTVLGQPQQVVPCRETSPEDMVLALDRGMGSGQPLVVALCMVASAEGKELDPEVGMESEPPLVVALCMETSPEDTVWVVDMEQGPPRQVALHMAPYFQDMVLAQPLLAVPYMKASPEDMVMAPSRELGPPQWVVPCMVPPLESMVLAVNMAQEGM
ncbi:hypothetical protein JRQ81_009266 [Phrynocephalus forsythii]|uniref:Uncharacterized protein n=1 Tax=Phrynocephalus forsythii TaxID=171643 RepID=A0A9Q1ARS5_9SAUR|nr:hypothetical protein JRQ81_009266 [Phrynocephalus forsythii]